MSDLRAPFDPWSDSRTWPFAVETDLDDTVTLEFSPSFPDTLGWDLWLRNEATGELFDLFPSLSYAFMPGAGANAFTIFVGQRTQSSVPVRVSLMCSDPSGARSATRIAVARRSHLA